jgi:hypothetical protein
MTESRAAVQVNRRGLISLSRLNDWDFQQW